MVKMLKLNYSYILSSCNKATKGIYPKLNKEINESFFELRNYNQLTERFNTTDPKEQNFSPYLAMENSPVNQIDPDGGFSGSWVGAAVGAGIGLGIAFPKLGTRKCNTWEFFKKIPSSNPAFYAKRGPSIFGGPDVAHAYSGFRWFFHECFDDTLPTRKQAKSHR